MKISESIRVKSTPEGIFNLYKNIALWPIWDPEVDSVYLQNGLILGAKGVLKPQKGPKVSIEITELIEGELFTITSKLPLCTMFFKHKLTEEHQETIVEHTVTFSGPLKLLFEYLIGKSIKKSLPHTLYSLKKFIEAK